MLKKTLNTLLITFSFVVLFGQITTTKFATPKLEEKEIVPYDSNVNFVGFDVFKYIGQVLYLQGKSDIWQKYGYDYFFIDYTRNDYHNKDNIYKCCDGEHSRYNDLVNRYYIVLDVIKHPRAISDEYIYGDSYFLKLKEKESEDILYFEYASCCEFLFPFVVVGFYEKQKKTLIGKEFVFWNALFEFANDIVTGNRIVNTTGQTWKCVDLTFDSETFRLCLIIEDQKGQKTDISVDLVIGDRYQVTYTIPEAAKYRKKFGIGNFNKILENKVLIGFTQEMCKLSWGEPNSINKTITSGKKSEQWVYTDNYLYFENGILTAIQ